MASWSFVSEEVKTQICRNYYHYLDWIEEYLVNHEIISQHLPFWYFGYRYDSPAITFQNVERQLAELSTMRARELRNILVQEYGVTPKVVWQFTDRLDLKHFLLDYLNARKNALCSVALLRVGAHTASILIILFFTVFFGKYVYLGAQYSLNLILDHHRFKNKLKLIRMCSKLWTAKLGFLSITIAFILELLVVWIEISMLLSWVIPNRSSLRSLLYFGFLSIPLASTLGQISRMAQPYPLRSPYKNSSKSSSWDIDVGSMVCLVLLKRVIKHLENFAARNYIEAQREEDPDYMQLLTRFQRGEIILEE